MLKTTLIVVVSHDKPIPEITDLVGGRVWTLSHVEDVTVQIATHETIEALEVTQP